MVSYHTDDNWALNNSIMLQTDRTSQANVKINDQENANITFDSYGSGAQFLPKHNR